MKIKHYSVFDTNVEILNWENLRNNLYEHAYFLPNTKEDYISKADKYNSKQLPIQIIEYCNLNNIKKIFSIGSGIALLEYQIKKNSDLQVVVSDFNDSIYRIKEFRIFDDALKIDILKDELSFDQKTLLLFPRIDTEFTDNELSYIFSKVSSYAVNNIIFIPAELLTLKTFLVEIKVLFISFFKNKKRVFCGYARSFNRFKKIINKYYNLHHFMKRKDVFLLNKQSYEY
jgi:hypothetical protein